QHTLPTSVLYVVTCSVPLRALHSFPTRRSSDLIPPRPRALERVTAGADRHRLRGFLRTLARAGAEDGVALRTGVSERPEKAAQPDRKSTRLNSSHVATSYAVFCLKKKKTESRLE